MDWAALAEIQHHAAALLARTESCERPACGRAYYAAYSLIVHQIEPAGLNYAHGRRNPAHADLPKYISKIPGLGPVRRKFVRQALRRLRQRREDADYRPRITVDRTTARESLRDVAEIFRILGEDHDA